MQLNNVIILGDSYSTFKGGIPEGFACYYPQAQNGFDVDEQSKTWWQQLVDETGANLLLNSSYSGSTICHTGYDKADFSNISFVARLDKLVEEGFFDENRVDTVIVFGGTNDSWAGVPMGEIKRSNWTKEDLYSFRPACCYLIDKLKKLVPNVIVVVNSEISQEVIDTLKTVATEYGATMVALDKISKICGHPIFEGMTQIKNAIVETLSK